MPPPFARDALIKIQLQLFNGLKHSTAQLSTFGTRKFRQPAYTTRSFRLPAACWTEADRALLLFTFAPACPEPAEGAKVLVCVVEKSLFARPLQNTPPTNSTSSHTGISLPQLRPISAA
jgi:hypothetical protein